VEKAYDQTFPGLLHRAVAVRPRNLLVPVMASKTRLLCDPAQLCIEQFPCGCSLHPTRPLIGGCGRAFGVRGKLHPVPLWLDLSDCQTDWTLKAGHAGFFQLGACHRDDFGKGTSSAFLHRSSACFSNGITCWGTLTHTGLGWFGSHLRHGHVSSSRRRFLRDRYSRGQSPIGANLEE
jgi:hypothetical protein